MITPPTKRIQWEYKKLKEELKDTLPEASNKLSPEEFLSTYNGALWNYLYTIYSYDTSCAISIIKINEEYNVNSIIKNSELESLFKKAKQFDGRSAKVGKNYLAKIDNNESLNCLKLWYVDFSMAKMPFGFDQIKDVLKTNKSNVFFNQKNNLIIFRGQASKIPKLMMQFKSDFKIKEKDIIFSSYNGNALELSKKLKEKNDISLRTCERSSENPFTGINAGIVTFSLPLKLNGNELDLDDMENTTDASIISEANEISKKLTYTFINPCGYKEEALINAIDKKKTIGIGRKISDLAIINFAEAVEKFYEDM